MDIDRCAEPTNNLACLRISVSESANKKPAIGFRRRTNPVLDRENAAAASRFVKRLHCSSTILRVNETSSNLRCRSRFVRDSRVVAPLLVEELNPPVRICNPNDLWNGIRHQSETLLTLAQGCFGTG